MLEYNCTRTTDDDSLSDSVVYVLSNFKHLTFVISSTFNVETCRYFEVSRIQQSTMRQDDPIQFTAALNAGCRRPFKYYGTKRNKCLLNKNDCPISLVFGFDMSTTDTHDSIQFTSTRSSDVVQHLESDSYSFEPEVHKQHTIYNLLSH
jgi:hypothetical protein